MARALGARRSSAHPESSGQGEGHQRRPRHPATGHRRGRDPAWRLLTYRQLQTGREQLQIAQQGQVTERFTRAIDQLGHPELDVRLGGIYALERIANDSPNDRTTIAEVLTAFVRGHAPWPSRLPGQYRADAPIEQVPELPARAPDVQAALTVLARRQPLPKLRGRLDLEASDLRKARLEDANLQDASLAKANLQEAILDAADLQGAILYNVNLQGAVLADAKLQQPSFDGAKLQGARLERAQLQDAIFDGANLHGADLERAQLQGAHLEHVQLRGAQLDVADLQGANLEQRPRLPSASRASTSPNQQAEIILFG
jgi:hypothetical protein